MAVTSTTLLGLNVWALSGVVTDAEIKTAWAGFITNNEYVLDRSIFLTDTCDLRGVLGGYSVRLTIGVNNFILHNARTKANTIFSQWRFRQTIGMSVANRGNMVGIFNGTSITAATAILSGADYGDGLQMSGGVFDYAVIGNPGGADPRFLNEMAFRAPDGVQFVSSPYTEQELQPQIRGFAELKALTFTKCFGFPQTRDELSRLVVFRSFQSTQHPTQQPIRPNFSPSICYVDSVVRRNALPVTTNLIDGNGSTTARLLILNNFRDESWFGVTRASFAGAVLRWNGTDNTFFGGVLRKLQFVGAGTAGTVKVYDSRSTTVPQRSSFVGTTNKEFLDASVNVATDASGRVQIVSMGAEMLHTTFNIVRFTGQQFTYQQFGKRVMVTPIDVTAGGDNDLSAFAPVVLTDQGGIVRNQAAINSATTINSFQQLLEELHVLAIGLSGADSYSGAFTGNLFNFVGDVLTTSFASVTIDATAANKIAYNATTNALTIKSSVMTSNATVARWNNASGTITLANGAVVQGVYQSSVGVSKVVDLIASAGSSVYIGDNATSVTTLFNSNVAAGTFEAYYAPSATAPTVLIARELYGFQRFAQVVTLADGINTFAPPDIPDVGITEATLATVNGYTTLETASKFYDRTAAFRLTEQGIKLGQIATRAGTSIEIGAFSHVINAAAASVYGVSGLTITTKSGVYAGDSKYTTEIATPPATITAATTEVITIAREDANGNSQVTIQATGANMFEIWKIPNATNPDNFATGVLLATVAISTFRFIAAPGFKMVIRDTTTNFRVVVTMDKGVYLAELFFGAAVQLAQSAEVTQINTKVDILQNDLTAVKGAAFDTNQHSLVKIKKSADFAGAISA